MRSRELMMSAVIVGAAMTAILGVGRSNAEASPIPITNCLIVSTNNISLSSATIGGNVCAEGNVTGVVSSTISGSVTMNTDFDVPTFAQLVALLPAYTNLVGNQTFTNATASGIYVVNGNFACTAGMSINVTVIASGDVNCSNSTITGVLNIPNFQFGLALYSGGNLTAQGVYNGALIAGTIVLDNNRNLVLNTGGEVEPQTFTSPLVPVPEPATMSLLGIGLAGLAALRLRRTSRS